MFSSQLGSFVVMKSNLSCKYVFHTTCYVIETLAFVNSLTFYSTYMNILSLAFNRWVYLTLLCRYMVFWSGNLIYTMVMTRQIKPSCS
jgi:hypothetical protein